MWFSRTDTGFRGWLAVASSAGTLLTGLTSGSFVVTVRDPNDIASSIPTVTESGKPGLYRFDVTSSFFVNHGTGDYGVVIEVASQTLNDVMSSVLLVSQNDYDTLASGSATLSQASLAAVVSGTWDANMNAHTSPNTTGALLLSASQGPTPTLDYQRIANSVWDESLSNHQITGSVGFILSQLSGSISDIYNYKFGSWVIDSNSNQMIIYDPSQTVELARYYLYDKNGNLSTVNPYKRIKV